MYDSLTPARLALRLFLGATLLFTLTGCPPQFTDDACTEDADCFADEFCNASSVCEAKPVQVAPSVNSFTSDVSSALAGSTVTLSWTMRNAKSAVISAPGQDDYNVPDRDLTSGSLEVTLEEAITYTLTATNGDLTDVKVVSLELEAVPAPIIDAFDVTPDMVEPDAMITFTWTVQDAEAGKIRSNDEDIHVLTDAELTGGTFSTTINRSRTFTLEVSNAGGVTRQEAQVTVQGVAPVINALTATPDAIVGSGTTTLAWNVDGATSLSLVDNTANAIDVTGKNLAMDTVEVMLDQTRTYILTAENPYGSVTESVQVVVEPTLSVLDFSAAPAAVAPGAMTTLSWEITGNVSTLNIDDGAGNFLDLSGVANLARGSVQVSPVADTTYTLDARGGAQMDTAMTTVTLLPPLPTIIDYTVDRTEVGPGASATVSWNVNAEGTLTLTLTDDQNNTYDISNLTNNDSFMIPAIAQTSVFTLTATNEGGSVSETITVNVAPVVDATFSADVTTASQGDFVTLSWTTQNATAITLVDSAGTTFDLTGKSLAADSIMVSPALTPTTQYTLTVEGFAGPITRDVTINVTPLPRVTLGASSQTITRGSTVTLSWTSTDATSVTMVADDGTQRPIDLTGRTVAGDSITDTPSEDTLYTITADDGMGNMVSTSVQVIVQIPGLITSFTASPTTITSGGMTTLSWQTSGLQSITIVNFTTGMTVDLTGKNVDNDSIMVSPTMTSEYRIFGTSNEGPPPTSQAVNITVN